jgi:hypothetical protein
LPAIENYNEDKFWYEQGKCYKSLIHKEKMP